MIVVNFKTYKEASGFKAVELARICREVQEESGVRIVAVPQLADLKECVETGVECWVQHIDAVGQGKFTGWISVEDVAECGARGSLLNHSEHRLTLETIQKTMELVGELAFEICICVNEPDEVSELVKLGPDYIAYEPAELIGSREKSVASEKPAVIAEVVSLTGQVPVLIGAGVHSPTDVEVGTKLGAKGVLLATDVVLAEDPKAALLSLVSGFAAR